MLIPATIVTLFLSLTSSYPLYNLYQYPTTIPNFNNQGQDNKALVKVLTPQQTDLIITIESNNLLNLVTIIFYRTYLNSVDFLIEAFRGKIMYDIEFRDAFWVGNQYLLIIGSTRKIFYRPPINGYEESFVEHFEKRITLAGVVSNDGDERYLTTLTTDLDEWILHRYAITYNSYALVETIQLCNVRLLETAVQLIRIKDFQCALFFKYNQALDKPTARFVCIHLNSTTIGEYQLQEKREITTARADSDKNTIYILDGYLSGIIVRYQINFANNKIQFRQQKVFPGLKYIRGMSISKDIMALSMVDNHDAYRQYILIASIIDPQKPFSFQYYELERKYRVGTVEVYLKDKELFAIVPTLINRIEADYYLVYTRQIEYEVEYGFVWGVMASILVLTLGVSFNALRHFSKYRQICLIEGKLKSTFLQFLAIIILHVSIFLMVISTDVSNSTNFTNKPLKTTSMQSYTLKMYNILFLYTTLASVVFQTCSQQNTKSRYLNVLLKHGLDLKAYFFTKQHIILLKAFVYSIISVSLIVLIDRSYPNQIVRLYPTIQQIMAVSFAYFACLFTTYNMSFLILYFFKSYWMYLTVYFSITFLISFSNGQFYLNNVFTLQQSFFTMISPLVLFSSITQHVFRTEVRFNQQITTYFLFGIIFVQIVITFFLYMFYLTFYYKKTSFQQLISKKEPVQNTVINSSLNTDSFLTKNTQEDKDSPNSILLDAFIPCKLSKNQGFQKNNVLKDIHFTGTKGTILTFLDSLNVSKPMLFKILINDQKSDSHIQKDLSGKVCYKKPVKISYCLDNQLYFKELTIYEHLYLFSILKNPRSPKSKHKKDIEFLLNQFNIPDQFRVMKARQLSGGYLKKMCLACAFIGDPDIVIIDQPTLGLDNRFRGLFYQKLKQWKENKLIIVGTSDNAQADIISDKIWILQKSKMIDSSSERQKKYMTLLTLKFFENKDFCTAQKILKISLKNPYVIIRPLRKHKKKHYQLRVEMYKTESHEERQDFLKLMASLDSSFGFASNKCLIQFSICQHQYDKSTYIAEQRLGNKVLQFSEFELYLKNSAVDISSDEQLLKSEAISLQETPKSHKILKQLSVFEKNNHLLYSQFRAILYKRYRIYKGNKSHHEVAFISLYSWIQILIYYKMNRSIQPYDFVNMIAVFCFLHCSFINHRIDSSQRKSKRYTTLIGGNSHIISIGNLVFYWVYLMLSLTANLLAQTFIIDFILVGNSQFYIWQKLLCSFLYVLNYTLFTSILTHFVRRVDLYLTIVLVTHISMIQMNFNSFVLSYNHYYFSIFEVLKYVDYKLTIMYLYQALLSDDSAWLIFLCITASTVFLFIILVSIQQRKQESRHLQVSNHINVHNDSIDSERVFIENIEDRAEIPLIGENLIHKYSNEVVLKNFTFHLKKGQVFGLLGHNGCGKTTVFNVIAGGIKQTSGVVQYSGIDKGSITYRERLNQGYCPQSGSLEMEMTVEQNIRFVGLIKGLSSNYVTKFMLLFLRHFRLKGVEQVKVMYLSEPEKKKLCFIISFLGFPKYLYFDEVTSGVEAESRRRMLDLIKAYSEEYDASIFFSSHNMSEAEECCDRISVLKQGIIKNGGLPMQLRISPMHEFMLLSISLRKSQEVLIVEKKKRMVRDYIYSLDFFRIEFQDRFKLIYSLDLVKVNTFEVWKTFFCKFYKTGVIEKFAFKRHGLDEVVKYSLSQQQQHVHSSFIESG